MERFLEEKVHKLSIIGASAIASASGGILLGLGLHPEYQNVLAYGPAAFVGVLSGAYYGIEKYATELKNPRSEDALYSASKAVAAGVLVGGSLAAYNTLVFYGVGRLIGAVVK